MAVRFVATEILSSADGLSHKTKIRRAVGDVVATITTTRRELILGPSNEAGVRLPWLRSLASLVSYRSLARRGARRQADARLDTIDEDSEEKSGHK